MKVWINRDHRSKGETMETVLLCLDLDVVGYLGSSRHSLTVSLRILRNRTHSVKQKSYKTFGLLQLFVVHVEAHNVLDRPLQK